MTEIYGRMSEPTFELFPTQRSAGNVRLNGVAWGKVPQYAWEGTFQLRNFPGMVFVINREKSYDDQIVVALPNGLGDFLRCSIDEFVQNVMTNVLRMPEHSCFNHPNMMCSRCMLEAQ